jgi:hypothetical protein
LTVGDTKVRIAIICLCAITLCAPWAAIAAQENPQNASAPAAAASGTLSVHVTDVANDSLEGKVEICDGGRRVATVPFSKGAGAGPVPAGKHLALIHVFEEGVPLIVRAQEIDVVAGKSATLEYNLVEGAAGQRLLREFDRDFDLAIDRAEIEAGTNPEDPTSIPGRPALALASPVLSKKGQWYRGELHAQSKYGQGTESVGELVKRAEDLGLDFLAIADPNTLAAAQDPGFKSDSVVLIPAMAWGEKDHGYALVYGPRTFPDPAATHTQVQAVARLVQAQGGVFAIAHPCLRDAAWKWYVPYANATEVWCRDWNRVPPMTSDMLPAELKATTEKQLLIYSIAAAARATDLSANGQASLYWDYELVQGHKQAPIAGSMTASPKVPMAQPVTYVYATEKSVKGILDGIRQGRTYVSSGLEGPQMTFEADAMRDGKMDVSMGGAVPIGVAVDIIASVKNAKGKKLEVLYNGLPVFSRRIDEDSATAKVPQKPEAYSVYRARVVEPAEGEPFGKMRVSAMSGPIYAEGIIIVPKGVNPDTLRIQVQNKNIANSPYVNPVYATGTQGPDGKRQYHIQQAPSARPLVPLGEGPLPNPAGGNVRELKPTEY